MFLRKDYVNLIQEGKAQVKVEKTEEHNEMLNILFPNRVHIYQDLNCMYDYYYFDSENRYGYNLRKINPFKDLQEIEADDIILDNTVIKVESEEHGKKVIEWWKEQGVDVMGCMGTSIGYYGLYNGKFKFRNSSDFKLYIEDNSINIITLPEEKQKQETMKKINWEQAQEIIDIACHDWKEKLTEKWAKNIVLKKDIEVSDSSYRIMRKACTEEQNKVFDKIFGIDKEDIDLLEGKGIGDRKVFKLSGDDSDCLMSNYICGKDQIWLNPRFNWTLKDNILTVSHRD